MNTKNNQRTRLSKIMFKNAMMDLLHEKKIVEKISVKELCEKAELNRSTFYAHYNEPKDLLAEMENEILDSTANHLKIIGEGDEISAHKYILSFLHYIKDNDKQFRVLLIDNSADFKTRFLQQSIIQIIDKFNVELSTEIEQYVYSYILNGSSGIITQWIRSDYSVDENLIVELLFSINSSALLNLDMKLNI